MKHNRNNQLLAAALMFALAAPAAQAETFYWDIVNINDGTPGPGDGAITGGGGFNWGTGNTRWTIDGGANNLKWGNTLSDIAVFTDIGGTVGVNEVNAGGITFKNPSTTGYTLTPLSTLHLGAGGVIQTDTTDGSGGATRANKITTKMQLMGTTATFSSNSANSTMEIGDDQTGWMALGTGLTSSTLTLNGTNTGLNRFGTTGTTKNIIDTKAIAIVKDGPGTWWLSGRLNFTGGLTIKEGTLAFSHRDAAVGTTGITLGNSAGGENDATLVSGDSGRSISKLITLAGTTTGILTIGGGTGVAATTYSGGVIGPNNLTLDSRGALLTMSTAAINNTGTLTVKGAGNTNISGGIGSNVTDLNKNDAGTLTLSGTNAYTGSTTVSGGSLIITGAVASTSVVVNGSLGGSGVMANATLSGSGSINPGNSPGILTAAATNPTGGLDYNFEFTAADTLPTWNAPTASVNDVLRLTAATTPFTAALGGTNTVTIYLNVASLTDGNVFTGGFYTDKNADFLSSISSGVFQYFLADAGGGTIYGGNKYTAYTGPLEIKLATVSQSADFGAGPVNGYVTRFTVVPEPAAVLLGGLGLLALLRRRRV